MTIDWQHFSPYEALAGGLLIGLASVMLIVLLGKIAGISSIVGGLLQPNMAGQRAWRVAFILGLLLAPSLYRLFSPYPTVQIEAGTPALVVAGLLVGIGTRYGSGCTSGHGICGISRLSLRSIVATSCFILAGFVTVYVLRHLIVA
ncbi:hypothetical protein DTO96_101209 [Ephemeroptericola cinctiostellae]|uniref:Uncharacterized protein n=1 Tax=Ephemeroptericola cinctiostellae TaxID=2268024 RepID=A0A345DAU0_9BURK|nr:YeeE/YedE family protein [Ephemeroptericola cinctiostellae]AXF85478.1 hypothetical protein DTO96_101209 [Ephemeroptericola cinctiostellae]